MVRDHTNQAILSLASKDKSKIIVDLTPLEMQATTEIESLTTRRHHPGQNQRKHGNSMHGDLTNKSHKKLGELKKSILDHRTT